MEKGAEVKRTIERPEKEWRWRTGDRMLQRGMVIRVNGDRRYRVLHANDCRCAIEPMEKTTTVIKVDGGDDVTISSRGRVVNISAYSEVEIWTAVKHTKQINMAERVLKRAKRRHDERCQAERHREARYKALMEAYEGYPEQL